MKPYVLSPRADTDLDTITSYLVTQGGTRLARYVLGNIYDALQFLAENPNAGHRREDLTSRPLKFWSVFSYMIIYDPEPTPIAVIRIVHAAQNLEHLLRNPPSA